RPPHPPRGLPDPGRRRPPPGDREAAAPAPTGAAGTTPGAATAATGAQVAPTGADLTGPDARPGARPQVTYAGRLFKVGRFGRWRRPIQASAPMCLATSSTEGLRASVHHLPTKVTIPTSAWA